MHTTKQLSERCGRLLRTHPEPGELEIARGRCDYLPTIPRVPKGSGHTFVLVTNDRILWTDYLRPERVYTERFAAIRSFSGGLVQASVDSPSSSWFQRAHGKRLSEVVPTGQLECSAHGGAR